MAIFAKPDSGKPVNEARAVSQGPELGPALTRLQPWEPNDTTMNANAAVLDGRFQAGGATGWERPGGPAAS